MPIILFIIAFFVYARTCCPVLFGGDSGELVSAAYCLGFSHPPGYPLYMLLGKLFSLVPFANVAFRLNLMSAFFAALSGVVVYKLNLLLIEDSFEASLLSLRAPFFGAKQSQERDCFVAKTAPRNDTKKSAAAAKPIAFLGALLFCFSQTFWYYATFAETYTLTFFLTITSFYFLLKSAQDGKREYFYLSMFFLGLSLSVQPVGVLFFPAYIYFLARHRKAAGFSMENYLKALCFFCAGLLFYAYFPVRIGQGPSINWGQMTSAKDLVAYFSADLYMQAGIVLGAKKIAVRGINSVWWVLSELKAYNAVIVLLGFFILGKKRKDILLFSLISFVTLYIFTLVAYSFELSVDKKSYYLFFFYLASVAAVFLAAGLSSIFERLRLLKWIPLLMLAALLIMQFAANFNTCDKSRNTIAYDYNKFLLASLEPNSIVFTESDWITFGLAYLRSVESLRPDVMLVDRNRNLFGDFYDFGRDYSLEEGAQKRDEIEEKFISASRNQVYFTKYKRFRFLKDKKLSSSGLCFKVVDASYERGPESIMLSAKFAGLDNPYFRDDAITSSIIADYYIHLAYYYIESGDAGNAMYYLNTAKSAARGSFELLDSIADIYISRGMYPYALEVYLDELELFEDYPYTYRNIGIIYYAYYKDYCKAAPYFRKYLRLNPGANDRQKLIKAIGNCPDRE